MITGIAVDTMVWSKAESRNTIMTPIIVILRSASVKCAVVKIQTLSLLHYRSAACPAARIFESFRSPSSAIHSRSETRWDSEMRQRSAGQIMQLQSRRETYRRAE